MLRVGLPGVFPRHFLNCDFPRKWRKRRQEPELPDLAWNSQTDPSPRHPRPPENGRILFCFPESGCSLSGTKQEPKPKLLSPDIFWWGGGSSTRRGEGQKVRYAPRNPGNQTFLAGYPGILPGYPGSARKVWEKNVWVLFLAPTLESLESLNSLKSLNNGLAWKEPFVGTPNLLLLLSIQGDPEHANANELMLGQKNCWGSTSAKRNSGESNRPLTPILLKSIAIHLPFLSRYFCKSMLSLRQRVVYTPPIRITIRLPFVLRYFCGSTSVRGR